MKRGAMIQWAVVAVFVVYLGLFVVSEVRWTKVNDPRGKFSNVSEYLAGSRPPSRVCRAEREGQVYFIAYGPLDIWLAVPSGPAAYVFDQRGALVEWSADEGDDGRFQERWPLEAQKEASVDELRKLTTSGSQSTLGS